MGLQCQVLPSHPTILQRVLKCSLVTGTEDTLWGEGVSSLSEAGHLTWVWDLGSWVG